MGNCLSKYLQDSASQNVEQGLLQQNFQGAYKKYADAQAQAHPQAASKFL